MLVLRSCGEARYQSRQKIVFMLPKPQTPWTFRGVASPLPPLDNNTFTERNTIPLGRVNAFSFQQPYKPTLLAPLYNDEALDEEDGDDDDDDVYDKTHPAFPPEQAAVTNAMNKRPLFFSWFHRRKYDRQRFHELVKRHPSLSRMPMLALPPRGWVKIKIWILQQDVYDAYQRQAQESAEWVKQQTENDSIIQSVKQRRQHEMSSSRFPPTTELPSPQKFNGQRQHASSHSSFLLLSSGESSDNASDQETASSDSNASSNMFAQDQQSTHPAFRMDAQGLPAVTPPSIPTAWMEHLWIGRKHLTFVPAPLSAEQSHAVRWHVYDEDDDEHANFERLMQIVCNTVLRPSNVRAGLDDVYMVELSIHRWRDVVKEFRLKSGVGDERHNNVSRSAFASSSAHASQSSSRTHRSFSSRSSVSAPSLLTRKRAQRRNAIYTAKMQSYIEHTLLPGRTPDATRNFIVFRKYRASAMTLAANVAEDAPVWAPPLSWPCTLKEWLKATQPIARIFQAQHEGRPPWISHDEYQWMCNKVRDTAKDKHNHHRHSSRRQRKRAAHKIQKKYLESKLALPVIDKRAEAFRGSQHMAALYADVNPLELIKMPDWLAYYRRILPSMHGTRYWHPDEVIFSLRYGLGKHASSNDPSTVVGVQQPTLWFPPYRCYLEPFVVNWDDLKLIGKGSFGTALRVKWPLRELTKVLTRSSTGGGHTNGNDTIATSFFSLHDEFAGRRGDEDNNPSVAVVVKLTNMIDIDPLQLNYMLHETSLSLAMRHPNIIRTFGWFVRGDFLATVMERSDYDLAVAINYTAKKTTRHAIPEQLAVQHPSIIVLGQNGNASSSSSSPFQPHTTTTTTWMSPTTPLKRVGEVKSQGNHVATSTLQQQTLQKPTHHTLQQQLMQQTQNRSDTLRTIEHWRTEVLEADATLSNDELLFILLDTVRALEHLHAHGIVHRDIKPANIMISSPALRAKTPAEVRLQRACIQTSVVAVGVDEGYVGADGNSVAHLVEELSTRKSAKLIDFGLAVLMGSFESIAGTPEFLPPALREHESNVILYDSGVVDIYAFGKMVYYNIATYIPIPQPLLKAVEVIATSKDGVSFYDEWNAHTLRVLLETILGDRLAKRATSNRDNSREKMSR